MRSVLLVAVVLVAAALGASPLGAQQATMTITDDAGFPGGQVSVSALLTIYSGYSYGWSYGVCHDSSILSIPGPHAAFPYVNSNPNHASTGTVNGGGPPCFESLQVQGLGGYTHGVVISCLGQGLGYVVGFEMSNCTYDIDPATPAGEYPDVWTFCDTLGSPPVSTVVVFGGVGIPPIQNSGSLGVYSELFVRGDSNGDGAVDVADAVHSLAALFQGAPSSCLDAQDANDDGAVDIADPVYILEFLFGPGAAPPVPFSSCGVDSGSDPLECAQGSICP